LRVKRGAFLRRRAVQCAFARTPGRREPALQQGSGDDRNPPPSGHRRGSCLPFRMEMPSPSFLVAGAIKTHGLATTIEGWRKVNYGSGMKPPANPTGWRVDRTATKTGEFVRTLSPLAWRPRHPGKHAVSVRSVTLRPRLSTGLPFSVRLWNPAYTSNFNNSTRPARRPKPPPRCRTFPDVTSGS
jgi:hypothetical protein